MKRFERYIGIDYSGAGAATSKQRGLRCFVADKGRPREVRNPDGGRSDTWSRHALHEWLREELSSGPPTAVGIDHAFSLSRHYFEAHGLPTWEALLEHFVPWHDLAKHLKREHTVKDGLR